MGDERAVGFCDEFRCDAAAADAHDLFERVRASFQPSPFTAERVADIF